MKEWPEFGKGLRRYINPATFPEVVHFLRAGEDAPGEARFPQKDLQVKLAHWQAQDHEMAYALPAAHLADLVVGWAKTHERGIRYPIPRYLRFLPEVAADGYSLNDVRRAGRGGRGRGLPLQDIGSWELSGAFRNFNGRDVYA